MKKLLFLFLAIFLNVALASEDCKEQAQTAIEIRDDYKTHSELKSDVRLNLSYIPLISDIGIRDKVNSELKRKLIYGQIIFDVYGGVKGQRLYKLVLDSCNKAERDSADRAARRDAREAAKASKANK